MRASFVAFTCALLVMTSRAFAQPAEPASAPTTPTETTAEPGAEPAALPPVDVVVSPTIPPPADAAPPPRGTEKSPLVAGALSFGITATGIALLVLSPDLAPHYDEKGSHDVWRIGVVTSGILLTLAGPTTGHLYAGRAWSPGLKWRLLGGAVAAVAFLPAFGFAYAEIDAPAAVFGVAAAVGGITYIGATIWEVWTAPDAARRHNEPLDEGTSISLSPIIGREPGLAISGRF